MQNPSATPAVSSDFSDFMSLDDLLSDAMLDLSQKASEKEEAARARAARKSLKTSSGNMSSSERDLLRSVVAQWEITREWQPVSDVAMFDVQHCTSCGCDHKHFVGFFQEQTHRQSMHSTRWVAGTATGELPRKRKENVTPVAVCSNCCSDQGWGV